MAEAMIWKPALSSAEVTGGELCDHRAAVVSAFDGGDHGPELSLRALESIDDLALSLGVCG